MSGKKKNMDEFLKEAFTRFIAIKDSDYKVAQTVFNSVFEQVKLKMCEKDSFFSKYGSQVMNAGSVYDGIKVGKLDEFDMDIVIRLPVSYDDSENGILIENHRPGFVKMKINALDNLDKQPDWERCHKVTREWRDEKKYFLQSRFRQWMHGVVQRAVSDMGGQVSVDGVQYLLTYREQGPAFTLKIRREDPGAFALDVDIVPVIRFLLPRWPAGYRKPPNGSSVKEWLVVPKPLKDCPDSAVRARVWRLAFHDFERDLIKGCELLKFTIRLMKKLRDTLEMKEIASYYIKTLFLWETDVQGRKFWQNKSSVLFLHMVEKLEAALTAKCIPYYWHKDHNLIGSIRASVLTLYADKLRALIPRLKANDADAAIKALLPQPELHAFRESAFYKAYSVDQVDLPTGQLTKTNKDKNNTVLKDDLLTKEDKTNDQSIQELLKELIVANKRLERKFESHISKLENKIESLTNRMDFVSETLKELSMRNDERMEKRSRAYNLMQIPMAQCDDIAELLD